MATSLIHRIAGPSGLASLMARLQARLRRARSDALDIPDMLAAVDAAGPVGSAHWMIAVVSTYETLKGRIDPDRWHLMPELRTFVRETGQYIPMVPAPILQRMRECAGTVVAPRLFQPGWEGDGRLVEPALVDPAALFETISGDREAAEAYLARSGMSDSALFLRYAQWQHSLDTARTLGAERVIDFGAASTEFARFLAARLPEAEICMVNDSFADGLAEVEPRIGRLGAPPFELGLFEDESVDLVIAHNRFERLPGETDRRAMQEVQRVLVRGGRFIITPFMVADQHALMVSPFSCFIANGPTDHASAIEAELQREDARIDFNLGVVTPVSRRYDPASAARRLVETVPDMTARLRPFEFAGDGFDEGGAYGETLFGFTLRQSLFETRTYLSMEFIKH